MTTVQYLQEFEKNLLVGGPKRQEIIREIQIHLQEGKDLGSPKHTAQEFNKVHLGLFSSFHRLITIRFVTWLTLELILPLGTLYLFYKDYEHVVNWTPHFIIGTIGIVTPLVFIIIGSHAISLFHYRWKYLFFWVLFLVLLAIIVEVIHVSLGLLLVSSAGNTSWYLDVLLEYVLAIGTASIFVMLVSSGWRTLIPRHPVIDLLSTLLIQTIGAYFFLALLGETLLGATSFSFAISSWNWFVEHSFLPSLVIGIIGTGLEWLRIRHQRATASV